MEMVTVGKLYKVLGALIKQDPSIKNKGIILSDDEEGNGYHGCYYEVTYEPKTVKECLEFSNGCREGVNPNEVVILG